MPSQLRLKYLQLLCVHQPSSVYPALISFDFPLDESLELVEKYQVVDAIAYLKYKLGRIRDALSQFKSVAPADQIIQDSVVQYLRESEFRPEQMHPLAQALFAYQTSAEICEKTFVDEPNEGRSYYIDFLEFLIREYLLLITKHSTAGIETKLKVYELKSFIFSKMVEDMMVGVARTCGTEELNDVFQNELENIKIRDLTSLLRLMRHEKSLIDHMSVIFERDSAVEKLGLVLEKVHSTQQKKGRIESVTCPVCEEPLTLPYFLHPHPCPHTAHLHCMATVANNPKEFTCPRCQPHISLSTPCSPAKRIRAALCDYPQVDFKKAWADHCARLQAEERDRLRPEELALARMLTFEDKVDRIGQVR